MGWRRDRWRSLNEWAVGRIREDGAALSVDALLRQWSVARLDACIVAWLCRFAEGLRFSCPGVVVQGMLADSRSAPPLFRFALEIVLLCLVAVVCGCASASRFAIVPRLESAQQKRSAMASIEKTHRVTVEPLGKIFSKAIDELPAFEVSLENRGPGELFFLPEHVSVFSGERSVRAYTRSELAVRIEREVEREAEEYTGQQAEVFLQSGVTRQDPSAALATITAAKRTNQAAARRESWDKRRRAVGRLIAPVRIAAGQADRAVLMLHGEDVLPNETLRIVIAIDSESYEFIFDVSPI